MGQLDLTSVVTVEGLKVDGNLNAVQEAMVTCHGAQCGYCTPGFVVAMSALFERRERVCEKEVRDGLTGNLCRCTGYEPIIKAALAVDGAVMPKMNEIYPPASMLEAFRLARTSGDLHIEADGRIFSAPATLDAAIRFRSEHAEATIVQGGTDVGVWVNKRNFAAPALLSLANVDGLDEIQVDGDRIVAGAKVRLTQREPFFDGQ